MKIHETAFLTCAYRSIYPEISKDIYAALYTNEHTMAWVQKITKEVSDWEPLLHCLRNRYFYEALQNFKNEHPEGVIVNMGAGFSMYPYLFDSDTMAVDIDQADIIDYKEKKLSLWVQEGILPERNIQYVTADFRAGDQRYLISTLSSLIDGRPSFIILEGVLYFLSEEVTNKLFDVMSLIQQKGSLLGCVSFLPEAMDTEVQVRLNDFFDKYNLAGDSFSHQMLSNESYHNRKGYQLIEHQDYVTLGKKYAPDLATYSKSEILNENMYLLVRE
jgi:O-methyltransferase involved in polyketide biosynthesis